jgi:hypothetical protein
MAEAPNLPVWHDELGDALPGAKVIIRVRAARADGRMDDLQIWGVVKSAQKDVGVEVELEGARKGEIYWVPPDHRAIRKAKPGKFRLEPSGEEVDDPDFIFSWIVRRDVTSPDIPLGDALDGA